MSRARTGRSPRRAAVRSVRATGGARTSRVDAYWPQPRRRRRLTRRASTRPSLACSFTPRRPILGRRALGGAAGERRSRITGDGLRRRRRAHDCCGHAQLHEGPRGDMHDRGSRFCGAERSTATRTTRLGPAWRALPICRMGRAVGRFHVPVRKPAAKKPAAEGRASRPRLGNLESGVHSTPDAQPPTSPPRARRRHAEPELRERGRATGGRARVLGGDEPRSVLIGRRRDVACARCRRHARDAAFTFARIRNWWLPRRPRGAWRSF